MRGALPPGLSQVVDHQGRGEHAAADGRLHRADARPQPLPLAPRAGASPRLEPLHSPFAPPPHRLPTASAPPPHRLRTTSAPPPHRLRSSSRAQRPSASLRVTSSVSSRVHTAPASTPHRRSSRPRCPAVTVRYYLARLRSRGRGKSRGQGWASVALRRGHEVLPLQGPPTPSASAPLHLGTPVYPLHLTTPPSASSGVWQHRHISAPTSTLPPVAGQLPPVAGQLAQLTSGAAVQQQLYQTAVHRRVDGSSSEKVLSRMIVRPPPKNPGSLPRTLSLGGVATK